MGGVGEMNRRLKTDYIQPPTSSPLVYKGKVEAIQHKGSPTLCTSKLPERWKSCWTLSQTVGGARGVMAFVVGNGHGDTSSNPGQD